MRVGQHRDRQVAVAKQLFGAMGIARDDKERRQDWVLRGFRQFDAPVSIVVTYDRSLELATVGHFDLGAVTYGLVLAASAAMRGFAEGVPALPSPRPRGDRSYR